MIDNTCVLGKLTDAVTRRNAIEEFGTGKRRREDTRREMD